MNKRNESPRSRTESGGEFLKGAKSDGWVRLRTFANKKVADRFRAIRQIRRPDAKRLFGMLKDGE